ncbi:MlaD family protein [Massilia horti]|uniref:MCE family protein n=1 Tax=Massilia horti TaxID=2562153 RepID=A0A4Y9T288_9BURK|nr:MlaD family protein [Massilia horti]TFW31027.1 MCE family protein [Massilia horti]
MEPEAKYTFVGVAVLVLVAMLAGTILWLSSNSERSNAHSYTIYFAHQSLAGLQPRSEVTMRGLRVGTVTGLGFSSRIPGAVKVSILVDPSTPVRKSTRAMVDRNLITGLATVQLINSTEQSPLLAQTQEEEQGPVIAEGESAAEQFTATLAELTRSLNATLSPENRAAFTATLANLQRASANADRALARVDSVLVGLGSTADEVRSLARSVATDTHALATRYDALGAQATGTLRGTDDAVRQLRTDIDALSRRANTLLTTGNTELRATSRSINSAADSVGGAADRLNDPSEILYGPSAGTLGPGEGKR